MENIKIGKLKTFLVFLVMVLVVAMIVTSFVTGTRTVTEKNREEGKACLEDAVRRAATACYAQEGVYPPDIEYLEENYGIQINHELYTVRYEIFASNLMPDITVLEN